MARVRIIDEGAPRRPPMTVPVAVALGVIVAALALARPKESLHAERVPEGAIVRRPDVRLTADAGGESRAVRMRFALAGDSVEIPMEVRDPSARLNYAWQRRGGEPPVAFAPLGVTLVAPRDPGLYHLVVRGEGGPSVVLDEQTLAVMLPFDAKRGADLNGYHIGTYPAERGRSLAPPRGFVAVDSASREVLVSEHLQLGDFLTHDAQQVWPRYVAIDPQLIDKIELVLKEIASWRGTNAQLPPVEVDVSSGYRTPAHNGVIPRAASDSRHQYGDAADIMVDANADGQIDATDARLTSLAIEIVEREHPTLVGGIGTYVNGVAYVHVDARGSRARWRG